MIADQALIESRRPKDRVPFLLAALFTLIISTSGFFLTIYFKENLGFSGSQIGILFSAQAITGILAALPAGLGNDRVTSRTIIGISLAASALGFALMGTVRSFGLVLTAYLLLTLANWVFKLSLDVQVLKTDQGTRTGRRIGYYQGYRFAGLTIGTIAAGYLITQLNFSRTLMLVGGGCLLLTAFAFLLPPTPVTRVRLADYRADLSNRQVLFFAAWMFLFATHWGAENTVYTLFLRQNLALSLVGVGWYMAAEYAALIAAMLLCAPRMDDEKRTRLFAIGGLLASGVGHIGMVFQPVALSVAFRALHGAGDGIINVVLYLGLARLFAVARLGGNTGFVNATLMFGYITGSLIYGPLGERLGYALPLWVSGVLTLGLVLPLLGGWRKRLAANAEIGF